MTFVEAADRIRSIMTVLEGLQAPAPAGSVATGDSAAAFAAALARGGAGGATGGDVVADARRYLGVPYVFGGEDASGMDCSGLVQRVYADLGIDLPRRVTQQMTMGTEVGSLAEARPGDLIVTGGGEHILIYAGDGKVIHAPYEGRTVSEVPAYMSDDEITTIRRIIPDRQPAAAPIAYDVIAAARAAILSGAA